MSASTVLILGGTGVVGSHLAGRLATDGLHVKVLSRSARFVVPDAVRPELSERIELVAGDIEDGDILKELLQKADAVIYQAASVGAAGAVENAREYVQANIGGIANLVDVLRSSKSCVEKVILGSSISVYGEGAYDCERCGVVRPRIRYNDKFKGSDSDWNPRCPNCASHLVPTATSENAERLGESIYAVTKKAQEDLLAGTCSQLGISLSVLRYSTMISPWQSWHNPFTRFLELLAAGEAPVLHEDGMQSRNFIDALDVVEGTLLTLGRESAGVEFFNIASGDDVPLLHFTQKLAQAMAQRMGTAPLEPSVDDCFVSGDVRHCKLDCSNAKTSFGFEPTIELSKSIADLVDWFLQRKGLARKP